MDNGDKINRMKKIKKAILPVAGLGTRFLPATKATPKEMLSIIDKPLVQYAVEEAVEIGIEEIIFITSPSKHSIKKHFDKSKEFEDKLRNTNKHELHSETEYHQILMDLVFQYIHVCWCFLIYPQTL